MKTLFFLCGAMCLLAVAAEAQQKGVASDAKFEVHRRGNHVEEVGTVKAGPPVAAAFSPPADDSHKWHATLIYKKGDKASEAMAEVIEKSPAMHPWINVGSSQESAMLYRTLEIGDRTQDDFYKHITPTINQHGVPMIIIQPPLNGRYGTSDTIVKVITGVKTGEELSDAFREAIATYVKAISGSVQAGPSGSAGAVSPPFDRPNPDRPAAPNPPVNGLPFEWPPSAPKPLTLSQIRNACPGAPASFLRQVYQSKPTELEAVEVEWLAYQEEHESKDPTPREPELVPVPEDVPARQVCPAQVAQRDYLPEVLGAIGIIVGIVGAITFLMMRKAIMDLIAIRKQAIANESRSTVVDAPKPMPSVVPMPPLVVPSSLGSVKPPGQNV